jgi:predicted kinase
VPAHLALDRARSRALTRFAAARGQQKDGTEQHETAHRVIVCPVQPTLVVVTGAPGVGKTTVAQALARELGLTLISKDDVKEVLFDSLGTGNRAWSQRLGIASFELMFLFARRALEAGASCIVEANFTRAEPLLALPADRVVQCFCTAPNELVVARYASRRRHPGHLDAEVAPELLARLDADEWTPLELGAEPIVVNTTRPLDVGALAQRVRQV